MNIFYLQGYDLKANIGKAYNNHIQYLPDDSWICITDHDSAFLVPECGQQLHDIILKHGNDYDLLGCVTNRLRGLHQLHNNEFSYDHDINNHFKIACDRYKDFYSDVEPISGVAGVLMLFKKSTWEKIGGFVEGSVACDTIFNQSISKQGGKIGLMKGVYLYHLYRIWEDTYDKAINSISHLIK